MMAPRACGPFGCSQVRSGAGTLAKSVTNPAGTMMLSLEIPIWYARSEWRTKFLSPNACVMGLGGASIALDAGEGADGADEGAGAHADSDVTERSANRSFDLVIVELSHANAESAIMRRGTPEPRSRWG